MKVELSKTEIKTICNALNMAAKKWRSTLVGFRYFTAASQIRIFQLVQMYEALSEKLKAAEEEAESSVTEEDILNCFGRRK